MGSTCLFWFEPDIDTVLNSKISCLFLWRSTHCAVIKYKCLVMLKYFRIRNDLKYHESISHFTYERITLVDEFLLIHLVHSRVRNKSQIGYRFVFFLLTSADFLSKMKR